MRLEAQRLHFRSFLDSSSGQAFVMNAVQDGTLEPTKVRSATHHSEIKNVVTSLGTYPFKNTKDAMYSTLICDSSTYLFSVQLRVTVVVPFKI